MSSETKELDGYFEGTRREMEDMEQVWIDVSDDDPSGFSARGLYGFGVNIVGQQSADGPSRRVLLTPMIEDEVRSRRAYQTEGYMTAQLDADSARRVGQALIDAADEIDSLT